MGGEWREAPLAHVAVISSGKRPGRVLKEPAGDCLIPVIGGGGPSGYTDSSLFEGGVLITGRVGTLGKLFAPAGPCWPSDNALVVRPSNAETDVRFLRYALQHVIAEAAGMNRGAANPLITQGDLGRLTIGHPCLSEQRAIAHILGTLDDKIELNRRMNETLEAIARALFKSWFVDFDPVRAKAEGRDPGLPKPLADLFPGRLVDTELGEIPEGWNLGRVEDLCKAIYSGGTPSTQKPEYWNGDVPWLSSGETREKFIIDTERRITSAGVSNSSTRLAPALSTVIASAGQGNTRGQTSLLTVESYVNQSVVVLTANQQATSPYHLFFDLERRYEEFRRISDAHSSRGSLTTKLLAQLPAVLPLRAVVRGFDGMTMQLVERMTENLRESRTLTALRDALLPRLISGELRVETGPHIAMETAA